MRWSDLLRMSAESLKRRKLRAFLTILGVVIGTASIVVMISLGLGLQQSMYEQMELDGGTTGLSVTGKVNDGMVYSSYSTDTGSEEETEKYITDETIRELGMLEHVKSADPVLNFSAMALKGKYEGYIQLCGMTPEAMKRLNLELEPGGRLPDPDSPELELLFGNMVLVDFSEKGSGSGYWETGELPDIDLSKDKLFVILDQDSYYQTQGTPEMGETGGSEGESPDGGSVAKAPKKYVLGACGVLAGGPDTYNANSYNVLCDVYKLKEYLQKEFRGRVIPGQPTTKKGKPYGQFVYSSASLQADDMDHVEDLAQTIRSMGYDVYTNMEYINGMKKTLGMVQAVLGGIGAVSLLVAAIGIANTMMMAIYERTKEIGVMKVIGCSLKNIRQLFLLEAAFIGFIGGVAGNVLSLIISGVINVLVPGESLWGTAGHISYIPVWLMLASMGFAVLVGMAAGYFPAVRAMRLSPLAAIRNE